MGTQNGTMCPFSSLHPLRKGKENNNNCKPSTESFSSHVVAAIENSTVNEAGAAWSVLPQTEEGHVITLFQHGSPAAGTLNPSALYVNTGLPPSPEAVYKEPGKDLQGSVLN